MRSSELPQARASAHSRKLVWTKRWALPLSSMRSVGAGADARGNSRARVGGGNRRLCPERGLFRRKLSYCGRDLASDPSCPRIPGGPSFPLDDTLKGLLAHIQSARSEIRSDLTGGRCNGYFVPAL